MEVITDIEHYIGPECVLTVGMFDGVHRGHRSLLTQLADKARQMHLPSAVVTFWPHPKAVLSTEPVKLLNTLDERLSHFEQCDVGKVFVLKFDRQLSQLSPRDFIKKYLIEKFRAKYFLMGYNHHFGKGNYQLDDYISISSECGLESSRVEKFMLEEHKCSSSEIRKCIERADFETANRLLGYTYNINGIVIAGDQIGRRLGFRTANLEIDEPNKLLPPDGVYACYTCVNGVKYKSVVNIGRRPTFDGDDHRIETHILDYKNEIYGNKIQIQFVKTIRGETRFQSIDDLKSAIYNDIELSRKLLK